MHFFMLCAVTTSLTSYFCRIDSEHNKMVVTKIATEVGTSKHTQRQLEGMTTFTLNIMLELRIVPVSVVDGGKTYRKSLRNATNVRSEEVQQGIRIRSRQQRVG